MTSKFNAKGVHFSPVLDRPLLANEILEYQQRGHESDFPDTIFFASKHEYQVYLALCNSRLVSRVIPQYPVEIFPPKQYLSFPNGKRWKVDFLALGHQNKPLFIVEAKGFITLDFPYILAMLEAHNKKMFERLFIVFSGKVPSKHILNNLIKTNKHTYRVPEISTLSQFKKSIK